MCQAWVIDHGAPAGQFAIRRSEVDGRFPVSKYPKVVKTLKHKGTISAGDCKPHAGAIPKRRWDAARAIPRQVSRCKRRR